VLLVVATGLLDFVDELFHMLVGEFHWKSLGRARNYLKSSLHFPTK